MMMMMRKMMRLFIMMKVIYNNDDEDAAAAADDEDDNDDDVEMSPKLHSGGTARARCPRASCECGVTVTQLIQRLTSSTSTFYCRFRAVQSGCRCGCCCCF